MYVHIYIIIQTYELCLEFELPLEQYNVKHDNKNNTNNEKTITNNKVANHGIFVLEWMRLPFSKIFSFTPAILKFSLIPSTSYEKIKASDAA